MLRRFYVPYQSAEHATTRRARAGSQVYNHNTAHVLTELTPVINMARVHTAIGRKEGELPIGVYVPGLVAKPSAP